MTRMILLLGPTIMIFFGLQVMGSVPLTFLLFYGWLSAVPFGEMLLVKRQKWPETLQHFGLVIKRKNVYHGIYLGIFCFFAIVLSGYFLQSCFFDKANLQNLLVKWHFSGNLLPWLVLTIMFVNPFLEEIYWRGYLFTKLEGKLGKRGIMFLTSLFYSLYHFLSVIPLFNWPYHIFVIIPVFFAGIVWAYMRIKSNSLIGSIACHILADSGIMAVYALFLR